MDDQNRKSYIAWLNDAHALETSLTAMLEKQIEETEDMPDMQAHLEQHLEETKEHAQKIKACLERNGEKVSAGKDLLGKVSATLQGMGTSLASDSMVKKVHSAYVSEHIEIASYTVLIAAARELGDEETAQVCEEILADELDMAEWLKEMLPEIATMHMHAKA